MDEGAVTSKSAEKKNPAMKPLDRHVALDTSLFTTPVMRTITTEFASMSDTPPNVAVSSG